jgi:acyl dehydratase
VEEKKRLNSSVFKLVVALLGIVLVGTFWLTARQMQKPVSLTVMPEAPRLGEPVLASYTLNNPGLGNLVTSYQFYVDGSLLRDGLTTIPPLSSKTYQYSFASPVKLGDKINFDVVASSALGKYEQSASLPPFPPQIASSFISFASFSTTVMSSMATTAYYSGNFTSTLGMNTGLVISVSLIILLICLELAGASLQYLANASYPLSGRMLLLQKFRYRFSTLSWVLLIIFIGIIYTKIVMIISM